MERAYKKHTQAQAKPKIYRYCAYQERSHQEVKTRLYELGLWKDEVEELLSHLITEGFLNEERYAKSFARGKFRMKNWGRVKIIHALEAKGLTANCIRAGLKEISEEEYNETLMCLFKKKNEQLEEANTFIKNDKLAKYLIQKGFESEIVWKLIKESKD